MSVLSKNELQVIQKNLEEERDKIQKRIEELVRQDPFSDPDRTIDNAASDTEAQEESDHDRVSAMIEELKDKLYRVKESLMRLTNNTYGICITCGKAIDAQRLHASPTASHCLECAK